MVGFKNGALAVPSSGAQIAEIINEAAPGLTGWSQAIQDEDRTTISAGANGMLININPSGSALNAILTHPTKLEAGVLSVEFHLRRSIQPDGAAAYFVLQQINNSTTKEVQFGVRQQSTVNQAFLASFNTGAVSHYATRAESSLWFRLVVAGPRAGLYYSTSPVGTRPSESDWVVFREADQYLADMPLTPAQLQIAVGTYAGIPQECEFEFSNLRVIGGGASFVE